MFQAELIWGIAKLAQTDPSDVSQAIKSEYLQNFPMLQFTYSPPGAWEKKPFSNPISLMWFTAFSCQAAEDVLSTGRAWWGSHQEKNQRQGGTCAKKTPNKPKRGVFFFFRRRTWFAVWRAWSPMWRCALGHVLVCFTWGANHSFPFPPKMDSCSKQNLWEAWRSTLQHQSLKITWDFGYIGRKFLEEFQLEAPPQGEKTLFQAVMVTMPESWGLGQFSWGTGLN